MALSSVPIQQRALLISELRKRRIKGELGGEDMGRYDDDVNVVCLVGSFNARFLETPTMRHDGAVFAQHHIHVLVESFYLPDLRHDPFLPLVSIANPIGDYRGTLRSQVDPEVVPTPVDQVLVLDAKFSRQTLDLSRSQFPSTVGGPWGPWCGMSEDDRET